MLFCIMACEIQMLVLRVHMPTLHLALVWDRDTTSSLIIGLKQTTAEKPGARIPVDFLPGEFLKPGVGARDEWKRAQKRTGMRTAEKYQGYL